MTGSLIEVRRILLSPRWLGLHALAIVLVTTFLALGWWQWQRATVGGNLRSYGYALEWPVFALFVIFMWWKMTREELKPERQDSAPPAAFSRRGDVAEAAAGPGEDEEDDELAEYNRYLARLNARVGQRR